ncbi:MAG: hypothetical protein M3Z08_21745 [Chloroflexota bacterium]|nr:hypothetical protein [Chloroflexota bacterium]
MKSLNERSSNELRWVRSKGQRYMYELHAEDTVFATVYWKGFPHASALVESADGSWTITQKGLSQTITITDASSQADLATIRRSISGNVTLQTPAGREFRWRCTSFWRSIRTWVDADGRPLLHLKRGTIVQIEADAQGVPELALLVTLGWYLYKWQQEEGAFVAATIPMLSN